MTSVHFLLKCRCPALLLLAAVLGLLVATTQPACGQTLTTLYSFTGGTAGVYPNGGLVIDAQGNLYGTTLYGGWVTKWRPGGYGTVFELAPTGAETVLHSFHHYPGGKYPHAGLVMDAQGNLYGTTYQGGTGSTCSGWRRGCGTVFEVAPGGAEKVLYSFQGWPDGQHPEASLIMDGQGNLYGTTFHGGYRKRSCRGSGRRASFTCGTVFEVTAAGPEKVLYMFAGPPNDGVWPTGGLVMDAQGNLYGTTQSGGAYGYGTVFKLSPAGTETVLYNFTGGTDGAGPGSLVVDAQGNLYGTTSGGGVYRSGTVFEITSNGIEKVLYNFTGGADGNGPDNLIVNLQGGFYGITGGGGAYGYGTVFELTSNATETVLYSFTGGADGRGPRGLIMDAQGNLYGATYMGGVSNSKCPSGCGTVFKLIP